MKILNAICCLLLLAAPFAGFTAEKRIFESPLAGNWYPAGPAELSKMINNDLALVKEPELLNVIALIQPHAGYRYSGRIAAYGIKEIAGKAIRRVIIFGPSHSLPMNNCLSVPPETHIKTVLGEVELDREFIDKMMKRGFCKSIPQAHISEHSVDIQIPMLQVALKNFKLVPVVTGRLDEQTIQEIVAAISPLLDDKTLVIASSDFTHYGSSFDYEPFPLDFQTGDNLSKLDYGAIEKIVAINENGFSEYLRKTGATICGQEPIRILLTLLPEGSKGYLLKYDTSGRMTGSYAHSVSYASIAFTGSWKPAQAEAKASATKLPELNDADKKSLLLIARKTAEYAAAGKSAPDPGEFGINISTAMKQKMGVFVTLHKQGRLRGCIGEIQPRRPLYQAVSAQAVNSSLNDWRFSPVNSSELKDIDIEISALTPPAKVNSYKDIVIGRDGVILTKNGRSAVFLPQVATEQKWDLAEMLSNLAEKAGLDPDAWKNGAGFQTFQAIVFGEKEKRK
jgi:hypothetical protein